jgi:hypothetical protein
MMVVFNRIMTFYATCVLNKPIEITYPSVVPIYKSLMRLENELDVDVESLFRSIHSIL